MEKGLGQWAELSLKTEAHWKKIGLYPHHGIALPLASLRSQQSCGIGEFFDLKPFLIWCRSLGLDTLQLLPLSDSGSDPSPYNLISSSALNPVYLTLAQLPHIEEQPELLQRIESLQKLSHLPRTAYLEVRTRKLDFLFSYIQAALPSETLWEPFFDRERTWLEPYAAMQAQQEGRSSEFYVIVQYLAFTQMEEVKRFASEQGVFLKGDLPAFVGSASSDLMAHPTLFLQGLRAGVPPDMYNPLGQGWGFPICNFQELARTHFAWWKERLAVAGRLFHIYRIDHVIGLFRIWVIPEGHLPKEGYYLPSIPSLWEEQGRRTLDAFIEASELLPIAEDLGTVPARLEETLHEYGICGVKVIRWQRWPDHSYRPYAQYDRFSLTTVSTHDAPPLRLWWREYPDEARAFAVFKGWTYHPEMSLEEQRWILQDSHHTPSLFHINLLQEYLTLFPELSWPRLEDERINIPGTILSTNWTYRFFPFLEEMVAHEPLSRMIRSLL